jgi:hypothetical protein
MGEIPGAGETVVPRHRLREGGHRRPGLGLRGNGLGSASSRPRASESESESDLPSVAESAGSTSLNLRDMKHGRDRNRADGHLPSVPGVGGVWRVD